MTAIDIAGTSDEKYLAYNAFNQPTTIVVGSSHSDPSPVAKDEFAYGPNGERIARKSTWQDGGNTYTEAVAFVGSVEIITDNSTGYFFQKCAFLIPSFSGSNVYSVTPALRCFS